MTGWDRRCSALQSAMGMSLHVLIYAPGSNSHDRFYYFFYETMRDVILKSRAGSKALSTAESMLSVLVAGGLFALSSRD